MKTNTKKITMNDLAKSIEKLAEITANGFVGMEERLTKKISGEVSSLEEKLNTKIDKLEENLTKEIEGLKNQLEGKNKRIDHFAENKISKTTYEKLVTRVDFIEEKLEIVR